MDRVFLGSYTKGLKGFWEIKIVNCCKNQKNSNSLLQSFFFGFACSLIPSVMLPKANDLMAIGLYEQNEVFGL